jgi:hypothetical protein
MTRNSVIGQVKALSMIIAMQNFSPACPGMPWSVPWKPDLAPGSAAEVPPDL